MDSDLCNSDPEGMSSLFYSVSEKDKENRPIYMLLALFFWGLVFLCVCSYFLAPATAGSLELPLMVTNK